MSEVRDGLLEIIKANPKNYDAILFGGSGTAVMEATICSVIPNDRSLLIIINGAYGERMKEIAETYSISYDVIEYDWGRPIDFKEVYNYLEVNQNIEFVAMVHHETTTGILNSIKNFSMIKSLYGKTLILDAISSFAGIPIDINETPVDFLMSTSNKCIHGMPGLAFVLCEHSQLEKTKYLSRRSFYLSLYDQYKSMNYSGEMRFTPPVQVIYALKQAINEYFVEGGLNRYNRFKANAELLRDGLKMLGFKLLLDSKDESNILVTVLEPNHSKFDFDTMHDLLYEKGITIYPGKIKQTNSFRLSNIGDLSIKDINFFLKSLKNVLTTMEVEL